MKSLRRLFPPFSCDTLKPEVQGRAALLKWLMGYFRDLPSVRTEFLALEQTGTFLSVRELAFSVSQRTPPPPGGGASW